MYPDKLKNCTHALRFYVIYAYHPVLGQGMQLQMMILKVKLVTQKKKDFEGKVAARKTPHGIRKREIENNYEFH